MKYLKPRNGNLGAGSARLRDDLQGADIALVLQPNGIDTALRTLSAARAAREAPFVDTAPAAHEPLLRGNSRLDGSSEPSRATVPGSSLNGWAVDVRLDACHDDTNFRTAFLRLTQLERRRADRSRSPLSIGVFRIAHDASSAQDVARLLGCLASTKRETDVVGLLDGNTVAILLPDTNAPGLQRFLAKVAIVGGHASPQVTAATYPDDHFDRCVAEISREASAAPPTDIEVGVTSEGYRLKRCLDVVGAVVALSLLSPLMLLTALAILLTSRGPIIFRQSRLGRAGVPFVMYKFRSMRSDADDAIHRDFVARLIRGTGSGPAADGADSAQYKMKSDPRITPIGRLIRKTSIDELPQFFNVLKGDMSLVGPRPPLAYEVENYESWHLRRVFELRPGLTGIWQVEGRSKVSFDDMVRMDLRYLRRCSLGFDLLVLMRTVKVVLSCEGAE